MALYDIDRKIKALSIGETSEIVRCSVYFASRLSRFEEDPNNPSRALDVLTSKESYEGSVPDGAEKDIRKSLIAEFPNLDGLVESAKRTIEVLRGTK